MISCGGVRRRTGRTSSEPTTESAKKMPLRRKRLFLRLLVMAKLTLEFTCRLVQFQNVGREERIVEKFAHRDVQSLRKFHYDGDGGTFRVSAVEVLKRGNGQPGVRGKPIKTYPALAEIKIYSFRDRFARSHRLFLAASSRYRQFYYINRRLKKYVLIDTYDSIELQILEKYGKIVITNRKNSPKRGNSTNRKGNSTSRLVVNLY